MDDQFWVNSAQHGDLEAFNQLVLGYQDQAFRQASYLLGDSEVAEDIVQEAFLSAFCHLISFRGGSFKCWLLKIVTNACYDELRRRKRWNHVPLEPLDDDGEEVETAWWMSDRSYEPEQLFEYMEFQQMIQRCLEGLSAEYRTVLILVDIQGLDYEETASVVGVPLGTVKSRLARARRRIRDELVREEGTSFNLTLFPVPAFEQEIRS